MDFARNQLEKYGWKEGEGLGKKRDGQAAPIKTKLKLNSHGIGYNPGVEYSNNWWERVFNEAASSIKSVKDQDGSVTQVETNGEVEITTKRKRKGKNLTYSHFKKKSCLNGQKIEELTETDSSSDEDKEDSVSDDRLFEICGGRTGHKGSRHGLTLSGKLARLEQQEKLLSCKKSENTSGNEALLVLKTTEESKVDANVSTKRKKKKSN
ncbi:hypothetical protein GE061_011356 [Apolygus lucorum]|uniref:G patch domain-containing protein 4 n=1 Tax=Apolygus lucorum TaxID=248454 RepID=A0A8S9Y175_APOLU|nr:hypothetical protein GE061_011356 [Apolygus lucorum]